MDGKLEDLIQTIIDLEEPAEVEGFLRAGIPGPHMDPLTDGRISLDPDMVSGQDPREPLFEKVKGGKTVGDAVLESRVLKIVQKGYGPDRLLIAGFVGPDLIDELADIGQGDSPN